MGRLVDALVSASGGDDVCGTREEESETVDGGALGALVVDGSWIGFCLHWSDMFARDHAGYWCRGVRLDNEAGGGWLGFEQGDGPKPTEEDEERAIGSFVLGRPLPAGWFRIDRAFAVRAWVAAAKRWGVDWYREADASRYDLAWQLAALGEARYG